MVNLQANVDDDFIERGGERAGAGDQVPEQLILGPNYPNPFNPSTTIRFGLPSSVHVRLVIMNIRGEIVQSLVDNQMSAGWHTAVWNGSNERGEAVASGIYLVKLLGERGGAATRKVSLVK